MQLFTTQLNNIQSQIEALQAERNRLQELENATAGALANLKAVVAIVEGDKEAITSLKTAIMNIFPSVNDSEPEETYICGDCGNSFPDSKMVEGEDVCVNCGESELGTLEKPCPATTTGECLNPECNHETFTCEGCGKKTPYCFGGDGDELCNDCWSKNPPPDPKTDDLTKEKIQELKKRSEEKAEPRFKKMFEGEPEPDVFDLVVYNDRVHRYENTLNIHFKLKRDAKKWADLFETKYHDCKIEIVKDDFESFGYLLKITKDNPDDPQWWQTVTSHDYSKSPAENHRNSDVHQESQELPHIDLSEEAVNSEFTFIATGMGWQKVIHNGEVLGSIYSNQQGWELETGEQFETREEAAQALFNSTPSAA